MSQQTKALVPITNGKLVPSDLEGIVRVSDMYLQSGLLPGGIKTIQAACVWANAVLELGIGFTAGLTGIAVVNGRPLLHSKLPLALAMKTGQFRGLTEEWTGLAPDGSLTESSVCKVTVKRQVGDEVLSFVGSFGVADRKAAGLAGKGTHAQYPKDMIFHRAKSRALERGFPDALCGMGVVAIEDEDTAFKQVQNTAMSRTVSIIDNIPDQTQEEGAAGTTERDTPTPAASVLFNPDEVVAAMDAEPAKKGRKL